jgi:hypothetical protein
MDFRSTPSTGERVRTPVEDPVTRNGRPTLEDHGWTPDDLRSAYAVDGSGPWRYAPDGSGPWSYDDDGSGPWLIVPASSPVHRGHARRARRLRAALTAGTLALGLTLGSVAVVAASTPAQHGVQASTVRTAAADGT